MDATKHDCEDAGGNLDYWAETFTCEDCGAVRAATQSELDDYRAMLQEDFERDMAIIYQQELRDASDALES